MKPRILLVTVFVATLMLSVRAGELWRGAGAVLGGLEVAPSYAETAAPEAAGPAPASAAAPGEAPAAAAGEPTPAGSPGAPVAGGPPEEEAQDSIPVPQRQRSDEEDMFSDAEIQTLQELAKRRAALDRREQDLATRAGLIEAGEKRLEAKLAELKEIEATLKNLLKSYDEQEKANLGSLVKIYENMKPKEAAPIFEQLDMDILLEVIERMKEAKVAPILAQMKPEKAKDLTGELARRRQLSQAAAKGGR